MIQSPGALEGRSRKQRSTHKSGPLSLRNAAHRHNRTWSSDASFDAPPPMGRFDEAKQSAAGDHSFVEGKMSETKNSHYEGKHSDHDFEAKHSESKVVDREDNYKDGSIFVDDLESGSEDDESDRSDDDTGYGRTRYAEEEAEFTDEDSTFDSEEEEAAADARLEAEDDDDEEEEEDRSLEDAADSQSDEETQDSDSSLSSNEVLDEDYDHLKRFVGLGVVVCFGEAWLRGTVTRYRPNDGRYPTKVCGVQISYDKAENEWLRHIDSDDDVQIVEPGVSWAQKFNTTEIGDSVIGLYNSDSSIWCPGIVIQKLPAPTPTIEGGEPESPRFVVRFENGQSAHCTCDDIVVIRTSTRFKETRQQSVDATSPSGSWPGTVVSTDEETDSATTSSSEDDEEFLGHRRARSRVSTPLKRKNSPQSIEFSWQQDQQTELDPLHGPPRDYDAAVFPRLRSDSGGGLLLRDTHNGSGKNLLTGTSGSRENLLHDPQRLLDLPLEELVEGGFARQVLSDYTRSPRMDLERIGKWSHCKCRYEDSAKTKFYLYEERTGEVLLAAKRIGDDFYISQYAEFPDLVTAKNIHQHTQSACGVLHFCTCRTKNPASHKRRGRGRKSGRLSRFQLWSTSCDYCDNALAKYVCGPAAADASALGNSRNGSQTPAEAEVAALKRLGCRQLLADFTQSNVEVRMGPAVAKTGPGASVPAPGTPVVEARRLTIALPTLQTDARTEQTHHVGWCDRCPRQLESTLQLVSAVPEWNNDAQRLTMAFQESHVREHSSKNFLVREVPDPLGKSKSPKSLRALQLSGHSPRSVRKMTDPHRACLQFGKTSKKLFTLSYRYPMSPMQGFGIALSHFNWMPDP